MDFLSSPSSFFGFLGFCLACGVLGNVNSLRNQLTAQEDRIARLEQQLGDKTDESAE